MNPSRFSRLLVLVLTIALLAVAPVHASAQTKQDVERAQDQLDRAKSTKRSAYETWVASRQALDEAVAAYEEITNQREELTYRISQLTDRIREYEAKVAELKDRARRLVLEAYVNGGTNLVGVAFEAGSIQDLLTSQALIDSATSRDLADLVRLDVVRREMDRLKTDLDADEAQLRDVERQDEELVRRMDELFRQAEDAYRAASAAERKAIDRLRKERAAYAAAEARRKAQAAAAARLAASGAAAGLPPEATPGFVCPVKGGASFINSWGFPRSGGRRRHKGVDMFAPRNTPVVAVGPGKITFGVVNLGGNVTHLYGDDGNVYYYAHLEGWPSGLRSGQRVRRGQIVGYVGNSGNARYTSPHLHFEIRPNGKAVNPYPTVRYYCP